MTQKVFERIMNIGVALVVLSFFSLSAAEGLAHRLLSASIIIGIIFIAITYFYYVYTTGKSGQEADVPGISKDNVEENMILFIDQEKMNEADFINWTSSVWRDYMNKVEDDEEEI
jgi:hypothetical protein